MNDGLLSQEEIDALVGKNTDVGDIELSEVDKDIIGEVGNISMSMAATTLSNILNRQVLITTPRVTLTKFKEIVEDCNIPKVVTNIEFKHGLNGHNLLMMDVKDASVIADLMMGGDGLGGNEEFTELELSAVAEAMNQMIGSAATSMATMLGKPIDIFPPDVEVWDSQDNLNFQKISSDTHICKISFDLTVEGLIQSEIMQIYAMDTVEEIARIMMGETEEIIPEVTVERPFIEETFEIEEAPQDIRSEEKRFEQKVEIQTPEFSELQAGKNKGGKNRNLDLIMDVPLDFSVVLGKSKKTIKEILSFSDGSVVELNKLADEPLEIYVNGKLIAEGEVVVINENFGVRITNILSKEQRVRNLN